MDAWGSNLRDDTPDMSERTLFPWRPTQEFRFTWPIWKKIKLFRPSTWSGFGTADSESADFSCARNWVLFTRATNRQVLKFSVTRERKINYFLPYSFWRLRIAALRAFGASPSTVCLHFIAVTNTSCADVKSLW